MNDRPTRGTWARRTAAGAPSSPTPPPPPPPARRITAVDPNPGRHAASVVRTCGGCSREFTGTPDAAGARCPRCAR